MRAIDRVFLLFILASLATASQDFCSLRVQVVNPGGTKLSGVPVQLVEGNGRIELGTIIRGEARFCGLGVSGVSLTIGHECAQVSVRNIPLIWGLEKIVNVVYDDDGCLRDSIMSAGCRTLLRFVDNLGKPIPGVELDPPIGTLLAGRTDVHGRVMVNQKPGENLTISARVLGYQSEEITLACNRASIPERLIVLKRTN